MIGAYASLNMRCSDDKGFYPEDVGHSWVHLAVTDPLREG